MIFPNQTNGPQTTGSRCPRQGLTLVEVLATIVILAVGSLSILVLFPVGAMKVKAALNNTKMAQSASNGLSNLQILVKTGLLNIRVKTPTNTKGQNYSNFLLDDTQVCLFDQTAQINGALAYPGNSNYSIPVNFLSPPFNNEVNVVNQTPLQFRKKWFSFQDDIEWDANGSVGQVVVRGQAFSTAYLIRKQSQNEIYDVTILVYNGRSPNLYDSGNDQPLVLGPMAGPGWESALALTSLPNKDEGRTLAKGSWIVETTNQEYEYYQIQSITEAKAGTTSYFRLELDRALMRKFNQAARPEFYWVDYLGGVFPKGRMQFN